MRSSGMMVDVSRSEGSSLRADDQERQDQFDLNGTHSEPSYVSSELRDPGIVSESERLTRWRATPTFVVQVNCPPRAGLGFRFSDFLRSGAHPTHFSYSPNRNASLCVKAEAPRRKGSKAGRQSQC